MVHVDLFATRLNRKVPLYVSPVPDQHAWNIDALNISTYPTPVTSVNNTSQTVPQPCVSQQSTTSQPPCLVSRSGQPQEQGFSVEGADRIAWSKLKRNTLGPLQPLRPFTVGFRWTKSSKFVTGKLTTHLQIFT